MNGVNDVYMLIHCVECFREFRIRHSRLINSNGYTNIITVLRVFKYIMKKVSDLVIFHFDIIWFCLNWTYLYSFKHYFFSTIFITTIFDFVSDILVNDRRIMLGIQSGFWNFWIFQRMPVDRRGVFRIFQAIRTPGTSWL